VGEKLSQTAGGRTYGDPDTTLNFKKKKTHPKDLEIKWN
jgi:hypothetical protein